MSSSSLSITTTEIKLLKSTFFPDIRWLRLHKIAARALFFVLIADWYLEVSSSASPEQRFAITSMLLTGPIMAVFHLGLWQSTIEFGSRYRVLVSILMLPSLLGASEFAGTHGPIFPVAATVTVFWSYWIVITKRRVTDGR